MSGVRVIPTPSSAGPISVNSTACPVKLQDGAGACKRHLDFLGRGNGLNPAGRPTTGEPRGDHDRDDRDQDHEEDYDIDFREPLAEPDGAEDPEWQRVLGPGREGGDDNFIKGESEGQQGAGN